MKKYKLINVITDRVYFVEANSMEVNDNYYLFLDGNISICRYPIVNFILIQPGCECYIT